MRYLLGTELVNSYLQVLKRLSKDCSFTAVTAERNKDDFIRDAFISGLQSSHIRLRMLENNTARSEEVFDEARALEAAQLHSESYISSPILNAITDAQPIKEENKDEDKPYTSFKTCGRLYQFCRIPFGGKKWGSLFSKKYRQYYSKRKFEVCYLDNVTVCGRNQTEHNINLQRFLNAAKKFYLTLNIEKCSFFAKSINLLGYTIIGKTIKPDCEKLRPLLDFLVPTNSASLRRVLGIAINTTPHERMFHHLRRYANGSSIPTWLSSPDRVLMKRYNRASKYEPLIEEMQLIEANHAHIRLPDGRETTVSIRHLATAGISKTKTKTKNLRFRILTTLIQNQKLMKI
ncbi:hypothetical protein TcasGA2_TC010206 [Tribolium castaneum]|uniref:Reverse transcriptase domain-containing protein n=1 Tax=Tribolium castaneum TaxID=7070 RepID=D6WTM7_TRICA|nr:hypothetical protein TcasGA2_TC010206 [Tribolium castaneum]